MKNIKFCFILTMIIFITGCDVKYKIEIIDQNITETANIKLENSVILNNSPYYTLQQMASKYFISSDFLITQQKEEYSSDNYKFLNLKNSYNIDEYINSYALPMCYSAYNVIRENNTIQISTSNKFLCYDYFSELSSLTISVKTNHLVIEHNADEIIDNKYVWKITKENKNNKPIKFIVSDEVKKESLIDKFKDNIIWILIIIGIIVFVGIIGFIYINFKNKRVNKI